MVLTQRQPRGGDPTPAVRVVHVVFKTHLDIGFTGHATAVIDRYMTDFVPAALHVAATLCE